MKKIGIFSIALACYVSINDSHAESCLKDLKNIDDLKEVLECLEEQIDQLPAKTEKLIKDDIDQLPDETAKQLKDDKEFIAVR